MKLFNIRGAVLVPLLAVSCATAAPATEAVPAPAAGAPEQAAPEGETTLAARNTKPNVICTTVRVTGSHIPKRRCTTRAQREEMRKSAEDLMRRTQRSTGLPGD